jgi:hypothetical protein
MASGDRYAKKFQRRIVCVNIVDRAERRRKLLR